MGEIKSNPGEFLSTEEKVRGIIRQIGYDFNNLPKKIEIGMTIAVAMGSVEPVQLKMSSDIVEARTAANISDNDIVHYRTVNPDDGSRKDSFTEEDFLWLEAFALKLENTCNEMVKMGYTKEEIIV